MKKITASLSIIAVLALGSFTVKKLMFTGKNDIKVPEPSDICLTPSGNGLYIASDEGGLYETDLHGKIIRKSSLVGTDFEGVYSNDNFVFVMDESARKVYKLDHKDLKSVATFELPYNGARNAGFESITFNEKKNVFVTVSEKHPVTIFEYDETFHKVNEVKFNAARDISSATWHDGNIWLLSDEDMKIFRLDPMTYEITEKYSINVLNPEGIAFDKEGKLIICSDDMRKLYYYNKP
ncbi:MAG: SdiA-regulated domain-containing protein [Ferruginibacter sp.]